MKTNLRVLGGIVSLSASLVTAQHVIPPPAGSSARFVEGLVPDWNQPNWHGANQLAPHPLNGGPAGDPAFKAWCVPTSVSNVIGHWDDVHLVPDGFPAIADGVPSPASSTPWASGADYQDCQANGHPGRASLPPGVPNDSGWYMNTNGLGAAGGAHPGTKLDDISSGPSGGLDRFFADRGTGIKAFTSITHGRGYASPGASPLPTVLDGFLELRQQVDANQTAIAHFLHWNLVVHQAPPPSPVDPGGIPGVPELPLPLPLPLPSDKNNEADFGFTHHVFGPFEGHGHDDLEDELYNGSTEGDHLGHAVTVVGYIPAGTPDDVLGNTNWIIVHDNTGSTPRNVAVPMGPEWVANTIISRTPTFLSGLVPDWNQPNWHGDPANQNWPNPSNLGPFPMDPTFHAWCVPTSMSNVLGHWDSFHLVPNGLPKAGDGADYPFSPVLFGAGPEYQDFQANGLPNRSSFPGVNDLGWYMNTNDRGVPGPPGHPGTGTRLIEVSGVNKFFTLTNPDLGSYTHGTAKIDPLIPRLTGLADAFNELRRSIAANRAAIAHFTHWNINLLRAGSNFLSAVEERDYGFDHYTFGPFQPGGSDDLENEEYDGESLGHAVAVVGYIEAGSAADLLGNTNWLIVHDNSGSTPRNVAVPMAGEWMANTIVSLLTDSDHDGHTDIDECLAGTDPLDSLSKLVLLRAAPGGSANVVEWMSVRDKRYQVEFFDTTTGSWTVIGTVLATRPTTSFSDTDPTRTALGTALYRVAVAP